MNKYNIVHLNKIGPYECNNANTRGKIRIPFTCLNSVNDKLSDSLTINSAILA